ncbi:MAG: Hemerythrin cation binding domain protein [Pedobacter sp.]|jgi:hemerythrin-like domain-containing protein|nr:Hemerythrin cation binding domain protein [Pedobacter sp.]
MKISILNAKADEDLKDRRAFIQQSVKMAAVTGLTGLTLFSACAKSDEEEGQKVSPPEDLMQEHGLLNRILLIYDACHLHLINKESFNKQDLGDAAGIIKTFIEDYHEKQEEQSIFPRFRKANQLTELVNVLLQQHAAGRAVTAKIIQLTSNKNLTDVENQQLLTSLVQFTTMYRPHESREDTILFPAFRKLVSSHEYDALGEEFEKNEKKKFGEDGFESVLNKVESLEKRFNLYELAQFTPKI